MNLTSLLTLLLDAIQTLGDALLIIIAVMLPIMTGYVVFVMGRSYLRMLME